MNTPTISINDLTSVRIAIACTLANEKDSISDFINQMLDQCQGIGEVKFIAVFDDSDQDGTRELVQEMSRRDPRIISIYNPNCKNVVDAIICAYEEAINTGYEWILEINAGFRHQPSDLIKFLPYISQGYLCIFGSRFMPMGVMKAPSILRKFYSRGGTFLANLLLGTSLTDMTSGYQLIHNSVAREMINRGIKSKFHFVNTEMKVYCRHYKTKEVPISYETKAGNLRSEALIDAFNNLIRLIYLRIINKL